MNHRLHLAGVSRRGGDRVGGGPTIPAFPPVAGLAYRRAGNLPETGLDRNRRATRRIHVRGLRPRRIRGRSSGTPGSVTPFLFPFGTTFLPCTALRSPEGGGRLRARYQGEQAYATKGWRTAATAFTGGKNSQDLRPNRLEGSGIAPLLPANGDRTLGKKGLQPSRSRAGGGECTVSSQDHRPVQIDLFKDFVLEHAPGLSSCSRARTIRGRLSTDCQRFDVLQCCS